MSERVSGVLMVWKGTEVGYSGPEMILLPLDQLIAATIPFPPASWLGIQATPGFRLQRSNHLELWIPSKTCRRPVFQPLGCS